MIFNIRFTEHHHIKVGIIVGELKLMCAVDCPSLL